MILKLSWPPRQLSPNSRAHYMEKSRVAKRYRREAAYLTLMEIKFADNKRYVKTKKPLLMNIYFFPPDDRKRDDDNLAACMKPARDGIAEALGIDDNQIIQSSAVESKKGGYVEVHIHER